MATRPVNRIYPKRYVGPMPSGKSHPQLILFSDGHPYVVKFKNNPRGNWVLVNEYVTNKLAEQLQLPIPPFEVVHVSKRFIKDHPVLSALNFKAGSQVASRYIENSATLRELRPGKKEIKNREHGAGLIVFDHWVGNLDRKRHNLLLERSGNKYYLRMIDHSNCFHQANKKMNRYVPVDIKFFFPYKWCVSLMDNEAELVSFAEKIKQISENTIYDIIQSIPEDWNFRDGQKKKMYRYLLQRRSSLTELMEDFIEKYLRSSR